MANTCPLCGQLLPHAIDPKKLQIRLKNLTAAATEAEHKKLEREYAARLEAERKVARNRIEDAKAQAHAQAERQMRREIKEAKLQLQKQNARELERLRREASSSAQRETKLAVERIVLHNERKVDALQAAREKEQIRHSSEIAQLQGKLEALGRRLEKQSAGQYGEEAEFDLHAHLTKTFPTDNIDRVGRGIRGADIVHRIMEGGNEIGRIVYESKNVAIWQNSFIAQVKKYRTMYDTPCVMIASRVFPKKLKGMCVFEGVPIVEPCFASSLASVMREGLVEIAKLKLSKVDAGGKAKQLFDYVVGNEFQTRFRDVADAVTELRCVQNKERNWHENHWTKQTDLYERIQKRHREIDAKVQLLLSADLQRKVPSVPTHPSQEAYPSRLV